MQIAPYPFQKGDKVKTPRGVGIVTAVGHDDAGNVAYRVGRNQYWYGFQLRKVRE